MKSVILSLTLAISAITLEAAFMEEALPYNAKEEDLEYKRYIPLEDDDGVVTLTDLLSLPLEERGVTVSDVIYYLYTTKSKDTPTVIRNNDHTLLESSEFDASKDTLFLIHGWRNNYTSSMFQDIRPKVFQTGYDVNVISVDWSARATKNYLVARTSVDDVGAIVGTFITNIQSEYGISGEKIMLVGHSLGAHVAGVAGSKLSDPALSIVGLDPAAPLFIIGGSDTLKKSNARHVEVIHTNGRLLGFQSALGDSDFYPNGGLRQPGCGLDLVGTCAHGRAYEYYAESIVPANVFEGRQCKSLLSFNLGKCDHNDESVMGRLYVNGSAVEHYYLETRSNTPYALE